MPARVRSPKAGAGVSLRSLALPQFWRRHRELPESVRRLADSKFALFEIEPFHPSLGLQQKGEVWTVNIGRSYRAIAYREGNDCHWFWIGSHEAYNELLGRVK